MKRRYWIILMLVCCRSYLLAQELFTVVDTFLLEEFTITESIPLDAQSVLDLSRSSRFSSIDQINSRLEGISLIRRGAYAMEPQMDGFSGGQIIMTIDGMRMFGACTDRMDPVTSYIEPENLESLSITHGTNGSLNGSTVGGSFDMALKDPEISGNSDMLIEAGLGYETVSQGINSHAAFELYREKWAFRTAGNFRKHSSYRGGDGLTVPFSYFRKLNLHSVLKYEPRINHTLRFDYLIDNARDVGYPALPMDVGFAKARIYSMEYKYDSYHEGISFLKAKVYYNSVFHLMDDSNRDSTFRLKDSIGEPGDTVYMRMDMPGWNETYGIYLEGKANLGERNSLYVKLDDYLNYSKANMTMFMNYPRYPSEPPMFAETWPDLYRNVLGLFIRNSYLLSRSTTVSLEGRLDFSRTRVTSQTGHAQFEIFGYDIDWGYFEIPKSINFNVNSRYKNILEFDAGMGYGERLPTNSEQFGFYLFNALDGYDYLGNPDLDLERSKHVWSNLYFTWTKVKISLRNRYSYISNYVLGIVDPETPQMNIYASGLKQYQNIPYAQMFGSSIQLQWNPVKSLTLYSLSKYTYGRTSQNDPLPLIPPLKNITFCKLEKKTFSLQLEAEFSSDQKRINAEFGESQTPSYSIFHLRTGFYRNLSLARIEISTGIENVFDKEYSEHLDWGDYLRPGRNIYLNLKIIL